MELIHLEEDNEKVEEDRKKVETSFMCGCTIYSCYARCMMAMGIAAMKLLKESRDPRRNTHRNKWEKFKHCAEGFYRKTIK